MTAFTKLWATIFVFGRINLTSKLLFKLSKACTLLLCRSEKFRATYRGWSNIVFESDSKVVVDAIYANHHGISKLSNIISSIKLLLQCNLNFEIKFTKWQANMAAHTLARAAISWSSLIFFNYVLHCIELIIINEMSWLCLCQKKWKMGLKINNATKEMMIYII
jgi:hypothetical protein